MQPAFVLTSKSERRRKIRYPLHLAACYRTIGRPPNIAGIGRTLNMSSSGLLFSCEHAFEAGTRIEVTVEWPSLLDSIVPLQVVILGRIVRSENSSCGMSFTHYQFRTMKRTRDPGVGAMAGRAVPTIASA